MGCWRYHLIKKTHLIYVSAVRLEEYAQRIMIVAIKKTTDKRKRYCLSNKIDSAKWFIDAVKQRQGNPDVDHDTYFKFAGRFFSYRG